MPLSRYDIKRIAKEIVELQHRELSTAVTQQAKAMSEIWLDSNQATSLLRISYRQLLRLISSGEIPYERPGGRYKFRKSELIDYISGKKRFNLRRA